ncbi:Adenine nucleotide alpha hydrolases-like superfamily protein [Hibiscus syriacus]|uniref:Adenine nucleotide alpha hydrolases-like superfamily protein n=1 Tax=Hibiscus syriacus TaxID=106335 RepID=A0A6A2WCA0_HIBSY|nr:uncharacterized protein LOC120195645 [Hibiscus syriacus]KAE8655752.1 Adenine nucleotide alpha hydrolases-like superfamily protein [Hibiscus syriacus]
MEAFEKPTKSLSGDKSFDQAANEGSKASEFTVGKPWENGFRVSINGKEVSCVGEDVEVLEDSEMNGVSSLLQMKESVRNIGVNDGRCERNEGFGTLLGAVDQSKEIVLPNGGGDDDETAKFDQKDNGGKIIMNGIDDDDCGGGEISAGYFVWGKIKNHPWWPGQVYTPTDASDYAVKLRQKGRLLVAYFGDCSFAWCHPSRLKPFKENFEDMSKLSSSNNFVNAVHASVDEIGRLVESKMTCSCVLKENCVGLNRPLSENAGIKEGVLVPEGGIEKVSIGLFEPKEVLGKLKQISRAVSMSNLLECAVLSGWLSAYNRSMGHPRMQGDLEPQLIPDIEENVKTLVVDMSDCNEAVGVPITRPVEEVWISSASGLKSGQDSRTFSRHPEISEDAMHDSRKQRSIAEILKADIGVQDHKVTKSDERASRKKTKGNDKANGDDGSNSSFIPEKGKGTELSGSHAETDVNGANVEMDKGYSSRGRKTKIKQASNNNGDNRGNDYINTVSAKRKVYFDPRISRNDSFSRERKKSKYLSPPYTSSTGKLKRSDIENESIDVSNDTRFREMMTKATGNLGEKNALSEEVHTEQETSNGSSSSTPNQYPDRISDLAKDEISANEVLVAVRSIALSPQYQRKTRSFELTVKFLSVFRSSVYRDGFDCKTYIRFQHGKKRKSPDFPIVSLGSDAPTDGQIPSGHRSQKKKVGKKKETEMDRTKPKQNATAAVLKKNDKDADGNDLPASLFMTFDLGSSLPKKDDLIRIYSRYGTLDMEDTNVFDNNFCARVVFLRTSDAEEALSSSQNDSPFGSANVSFRLRLHQAASGQNQKETPSAKMSSPLAKEGTERLSESSAPGNLQLSHMKQKLEMLTSMLQMADEKMSSETKSKLQSEIKGLLEVVNTMIESTS